MRKAVLGNELDEKTEKKERKKWGGCVNRVVARAREIKLFVVRDLGEQRALS
ncbi:hypothetical protein WN55_10541 [Dufourea novaeangliae]|uniref:Uncharacterized protein n=1 Tax=Dufourea novaeangliae TaxID=178035 RepID=A0A154P661_DUFNO|nr:hypothetical protein WN55_10541 [Dufourea novaeangliae]